MEFADISGWLAIDAAQKGKTGEARKLKDELMQENRPQPVNFFNVVPVSRVVDTLRLMRRAIDLIELLVGKFPDDYLAHEDLGVLYLIAGDLPRWEETQKEL